MTLYNKKQTKSGAKVKAWIEAMRLRTLPVSVAGVLAGTACAIQAGHFNLIPFLICMLFAITAQIASNFANEYYDFRNGLDRKGRDGFRRGVTEGDISPEAMKRATYILLTADCLLGCSLIWFGGWWLITIGILIALFAIGYSAGPYPLSHHGLGDIAVIVFFGIVPVTLTAYLQIGEFPSYTNLWLITGLAVGMLADEVLIVNNYRDMEDDAAVGKHTTVVIFGRKVMSYVYLIFFTCAMAIFSILTYSSNHLWAIAWGIFELLYMAIWVRMIGSRGKKLNDLLKFSAILMLMSCVLLIISAL